METLALENLSFSYPECGQNAVDRVSFTVDRGDFFVLFGASGCGKTTLLRLLKPAVAPHGNISGKIFFDGRDINTLSERECAEQIGFVSQSPENQIVTDKVWHELAFGAESLGWDTPKIRRRVAETAAFFGLTGVYNQKTALLSGGQKQLLNLASVMVTDPKLLILDEPASRLDPVAASEFLAMLKKLNRELGVTVILCEHRLEEALPLASRAAFMENGRVEPVGGVNFICGELKRRRHPMFIALPAAARIWASVESEEPCPVSVNEGRDFLEKFAAGRELLPIPSPEKRTLGEEAVSAKGVWFRYEQDDPDVLKNLDLSARAGELLCVLGGNGSGKSTLLKVLSGIKKPYRGRISARGKIAYLPQEPETLFLKKTLFEDLLDAAKETAESDRASSAERMIKLCRLQGLEGRHPYDLSGGEQQRAAIAKLLLLSPDILLLDEPTKGLDAPLKEELAGILRALTQSGICVVAVSHDIDFCAVHADRCAMLFDGSIAAEGEPKSFFEGNGFYTTSANRISRGMIPSVVTIEDAAAAIGGRQIKPDPVAIESYIKPPPQKKEPPEPPLSPARRILAWIFGILSACGAAYALLGENLADMTGAAGITLSGVKQLALYGVSAAFFIAAALIAFRRGKDRNQGRVAKGERKLSRRTVFSIALILFFIPLTLFLGLSVFGSKKYYITAFAVLIECMLPFFLVFEGRKPKPRELVIVAVLCALGIAGRAAFFWLPQFKPVLALTVIAGVALGGETGFLVGAVTMLVSNVMFSQGPWTPWQMFAMGIIGFLAGVLYRKGLLCRSKGSLCAFGAASAVVIYGGILNPAAALIWSNESLNAKIMLAYCLTGFPMDCVHAAATALFLWFLAEPLLEKLDRVKTKYGVGG